MHDRNNPLFKLKLNVLHIIKTAKKIIILYILIKLITIMDDGHSFFVFNMNLVKKLRCTYDFCFRHVELCNKYVVNSSRLQRNYNKGFTIICHHFVMRMLSFPWRSQTVSFHTAVCAFCCILVTKFCLPKITQGKVSYMLPNINNSQFNSWGTETQSIIYKGEYQDRILTVSLGRLS